MGTKIGDKIIQELKCYFADFPLKIRDERSP